MKTSLLPLLGCGSTVFAAAPVVNSTESAPTADPAPAAFSTARLVVSRCSVTLSLFRDINSNLETGRNKISA
jgi:hypothetical protein